VQAIRLNLKKAKINDSWTQLRETLAVQCRVTSSVWRKDGRTIHVRKSTIAEPGLMAIYKALAINPAPGWNKIEHRMFSHISMNWRGRSLTSHETIVNLIGSTTTQTGLTINAELDVNHYEKGIHVSDKEMGLVNLTKAKFYGEWNYSIDTNCSS